ncbi:hypothetical protein YC2023_024951 [Brassica napus]
MFFSRPMRNAASARAARRVPVPAASSPDTSYSLTKACKQSYTIEQKMETQKSFIWSLLGVMFV